MEKLMRALTISEVHQLVSRPSETITVTGTPPTGGGGSPPIGGGGGGGSGGGGGGSAPYQNFSLSTNTNQYDAFKYNDAPTNLGGDVEGKSNGDSVFGGLAGQYSAQDAVNLYGNNAIAQNINAMAAAGNYAGAASYGSQETITVSGQYTGSGNVTVGFEKLSGILSTGAGAIAGIIGGAAAFSKGDKVEAFKSIGAGMGVLSADVVIGTQDADVQAALRDVANSIENIFDGYATAQMDTMNLGSPGGEARPQVPGKASALISLVNPHQTAAPPMVASHFG